MDSCVAYRARLVVGREIVRGTHGPQRRKGIALQAQQVHLNNAQKSRVGGGVWGMTTAAALRLDRNMFIDERSEFVRVTLVADCVAARQGLNLAQSGTAMDVVTVATTNEAFVDSVAIGLCEICFRRGVTSVAKIRLC